MTLLIHDIAAHRRAALVFFVCWLAAWGFTAGTWQGGMTVPAMAIHTLLPFVAGGLVGWWRLGACPEQDRPCGLLAGALLAWVNFTIVFFVDWELGTTSSGGFEWGVFGMWLVIGAVFAFIGAALGLMGGVSAQVARRSLA